MQSFGFMGFGEAAFNMALGLGEAGMTNMHAYDVAALAPGTPLASTLAERLAESRVGGVKTVQELSRQHQLILLAVPAQFTAASVDSLMPFLTPAHLIVDVTTAAPDMKAALSHKLADIGVSYADSPMLGPLPMMRHKTPMLVCGSGAARWIQAAAAWGMTVREVPGEAGAASRIKLARSLFTKSFEALLVETFQFARLCGVEDIVLDGLAETMDACSFRESVLRYLAGDIIHAARRAHELEEAVSIARGMGMVPLVGEAGVQRLQRSAALNLGSCLGGVMPKDLQTVYTLWEQAGEGVK